MSIELTTYDPEARRDSKMKSDDRVLVLQVMDGKKPISSTGNVDQRLFSGDNNLHATYDQQTGMWSMNYEVGGLPGGLQRKFTTFPDLLTYVREYFHDRNVKIAEVRE